MYLIHNELFIYVILVFMSCIENKGEEAEKATANFKKRF